MKKVLLFTVIAMMFITMNVLAAEKNEVLIEQKTELAQLYDMGLMADVGKGPFQNITRAEMAQIVAETLKMTDVKIDSTFSDVLADNIYANQIGFVQSMGIMCGYGDKTFRADRNITYYEVVKTIVTMLGYEPLALQRGGYPGGYLKTANQIGIILYPGAEDFEICKNDIGKILLEALDVPLMVQTSFGDAAEYQISEVRLRDKFQK